MTRTELSESMAEFIGVSRLAELDSKNEYQVSLFNTVFSPDGFFAVWDKLDDEFIQLLLTFSYETCGKHQPKRTGLIKCYLNSTDVYATDRYTAFYEAVHEMKTTNEKVSNDQKRAWQKG